MNIPPRKDLNGMCTEWKDDFKFVSKLDRLLSDGINLKPNELEMCNELYKFYSQMYMKNLLRK